MKHLPWILLGVWLVLNLLGVASDQTVGGRMLAIELRIGAHILLLVGAFFYAVQKQLPWYYGGLALVLGPFGYLVISVVEKPEAATSPPTVP